MKKSIWAKILSVALTAALLAGLAPAGGVAAADEEGAALPFTITADSGDSTITITASEEPTPEEPDPEEPDPQDPGYVYKSGKLTLQAGSRYVARDYAQSANVNVTNNTDSVAEYYLVSDNNYDDIMLNFVKSGSIDEPLVILPGETQAVELSIFTQNAT
ncbi:MAG: hypothetical protein LBD92_06905, partial [Oscillospiraceae bacterium]|nr:hypothetical protein [Oscillospiraceae bacterium]